MTAPMTMRDRLEYVPAGEWLYLRVYPRGTDCDEVLGVCADWLSALTGVRRWHFLRYIDLTGHHLRVRLCGSADDVDRWYEQIPDLVAGVLRTAPVDTQRCVHDPMMAAGGQQPGVRLDLYSPEVLKYGPAGAEIAERHFGTSSAWVAGEPIRGVPLTHRRALAARYLAEALPLLVPGDPRRALEAHTAMWGWRLPRGDAAAALPGLLAAFVEEGRREEASLLVKPMVESLVETLTEWRHDDPMDVGDAGSGDMWVRRGLNLIHMDVNRLGLNPSEECLAGLAARRLVTRP